MRQHGRSLAGTNGIPLERDREPVAVELAADTLGRPERSQIPVSVTRADGSTRPVDCVVAVTERVRRDLGTWCARWELRSRGGALTLWHDEGGWFTFRRYSPPVPYCGHAEAGEGDEMSRSLAGRFGIPLEPERTYVGVEVERGYRDGGGFTYTPRTVTWPDGRSWPIERVLTVQEFGRRSSGNLVTRWNVLILGQPKVLWSEGDRWFAVARKRKGEGR